MSKKKKSEAAPPKPAKDQKKKTIGRPDVTVLARYSPTDGMNAHPDWVKQKFPDYVGAHAGHHETTVVREFAHDGHAVKIFTTYRVEVDGQPVQAHLSVDEDGRVYTHATPFDTYASAIDLMKAVLDAYPESFKELGKGQGGSAPPDPGDGHEHQDHDHHHGGGEHS